MISGPVSGLFNVFIERARSDAAGAAAQLANAIAVRYGIPAAEVERRLAIGRFRVKGNVDKQTADTFAADLTRLGAIVTVAPVEAEAAAKAPAAKAAPAVSLKIPRVEAPEPPKPAPTAVPKPEPPKPAPPKPAAPSPYTSGLAAASSAKDGDDPGLGALSGDFPLTLSTLDGADDASSSGSRSASQLPASFGPPSSSQQLPASFGPPPEVTDDVDVAMDDEPAPAAMTGPADMFAPPEANAELQLALEVDAPPRKKRRTSAPPPVSGSHAAAAPPVAANQPPAAALPTTHSRDAAWKDHARKPVVQYVAGIVICAALALIPAAIVGSIRERSAFAELDGKLQDREAQVLTRADWDNLDRIRASFAERKRAERQSIAFTSVLLWAAIAGGLAYVWFRVIDWDRVLGD